MTSEDLSYQEITCLADPNLLPWLDLYETAFPPSERILVSAVLQNLLSRENGEDVYTHLLAVVNASGKVVGMAMYTFSEELQLAYLWYLAVDPRLRSQGIGARIYRELLRQVREVHLKALVFEVEIPERENSVNSLRRIHFYRRQGAFLLEGIHYMQHVGWHQEPIPMHVMVHPMQALTPQEAFNLANSLFDGSVEQVGELQLV